MPIRNTTASRIQFNSIHPAFTFLTQICSTKDRQFQASSRFHTVNNKHVHNTATTIWNILQISPSSPSQHYSSSLASATYTTSTDSSTESYKDLLHPSDFRNGTIPLPKNLSPSSAAEFKSCPQSYLFKYLYGIKQPKNKALAKGSVCHSALEQVFDLHPQDRTVEHLQNLFRKNWSKERTSDVYRHLFFTDNMKDDEESSWDIEGEQAWGKEAIGLLHNYIQMEDPSLIPRPNPIEREMWVRANLSLDPSKGITATGDTHNNDSNVDVETFPVRGIVDRLDFVAMPLTPRSTFLDKTTDPPNRRGVVRIIDYKTGKAPDLKYSPSMNQKIIQDSTWQLKIYALLLREMLAGNLDLKSKGGNLKHLIGNDLRLLRLMYLTNKDGNAQFLDMDLGETQDERDEVLNEVHSDLANIWSNIVTLVETQDPTKFHHCDRSFCDCHKIRPQFVPGTVSDEIL